MTNTKLTAFFQLNDRLHVSECNAQKKKKKKNSIPVMHILCKVNKHNNLMEWSRRGVPE
jgi:hypothetical protein